MLEVQQCRLFRDTFSEKGNHYPELRNILGDFIATKAQDPTKPFGSRDGPFKNAGHFTGKVPKLRHAHLMHDMNLCYTISGKDPAILKLYGLFKHDELGTGQPSNYRRQQNVATAMANQSFEPVPTTPKQAEPKKPESYKDRAWYKNQNK